MTADPARAAAFWAATDLAAVTAIVDVPGSLMTWASEALLNDADGYYGGFHNFLLYDQGQKGFVFLPRTPTRRSTGWPLRSGGRRRSPGVLVGGAREAGADAGASTGSS